MSAVTSTDILRTIRGDERYIDKIPCDKLISDCAALIINLLAQSTIFYGFYQLIYCGMKLVNYRTLFTQPFSTSISNFLIHWIIFFFYLIFWRLTRKNFQRLSVNSRSLQLTLDLLLLFIYSRSIYF